MISKDEAKVKLRKAGYSVVDDNAVVTVLVSEKSNIKNIVKDVKEILVKAGYSASFGVRQTNSSLEENTDNDIEDNDSTDINDESVNDIEINVDVDANIDIEADDDIEIIDVDKDENAKQVTKKSKKTSKKKEEDFFDDEDDDNSSSGSQIDLDAFDMDMLLNEESVQFSLEDFGMM